MGSGEGWQAARRPLQAAPPACESWRWNVCWVPRDATQTEAPRLKQAQTLSRGVRAAFLPGPWLKSQVLPMLVTPVATEGAALVSSGDLPLSLPEVFGSMSSGRCRGMRQLGCTSWVLEAGWPQPGALGPHPSPQGSSPQALLLEVFSMCWPPSLSRSRERAPHGLALWVSQEDTGRWGGPSRTRVLEKTVSVEVTRS